MKYIYNIIIATSLLAFSLGNAIPASADTKVGTPKGYLSVTPVGGAAYSIDIDCPKGVGGMEPHIALSYNSLSGYGWAGFGFTLTGFSTITRDTRDLFHDNYTYGVKYAAGDPYLLDGRRLVLKSGTEGAEGAVYTVEGNPYTTITVHGTYSDTAADLWFEVHDRDGMTYKYGETANARLGYTNSSGKPRIHSWYISSAEDANSNYISYTYTTVNYSVRPVTVAYGGNKAMGTTHCNTINFTYESLGNEAKPFVIDNCKGMIAYRLKSIATNTGANTFRTYGLSYTTSSDGSFGKFTRLSAVTEKNGSGEAMNPVTLQWNSLQQVNMSYGNLNVPLDESNPYIQKQDMRLVSADLNGDGADDLIRVSKVDISTGTGSGETTTYVYISRSQVHQDGSVSYASPLIYDLGAQFSIEDLKYILGGTSTMDIDGDGLNDIIIPQYIENSGLKALKCFYILGKDVVIGNTLTRYFPPSTISSSSLPLLVGYDVNGDGLDDVIYVERESTASTYAGKIAYLTYGQTVPDTITFSIVLPGAPRKMFAGDFNNDGLSDLIFFHDSGYKVYYNCGGSRTGQKYHEWATCTATNVKDSWRMEQGDFNGDGLIDFLVNERDQWALFFALNNADGTFTYQQATALPVADKNTDKDEYRSGTSMPSRGRVRKIADGIGCTAEISYATLADTAVYRKLGSVSYPLAERHIPLSVVSGVAQSDGAAGTKVTAYHYDGLIEHKMGKGFPGFSATTVTDAMRGLKTKDCVEQWNTSRWVPSKTKRTVWAGGAASSVETQYTISAIGSNYIANPTTVAETDDYANITQTSYTYDLTKGVTLTQKHSFDGGTYYKN